MSLGQNDALVSSWRTIGRAFQRTPVKFARSLRAGSSIQGGHHFILSLSHSPSAYTGTSCIQYLTRRSTFVPLYLSFALLPVNDIPQCLELIPWIRSIQDARCK